MKSILHLRRTCIFLLSVLFFTSVSAQVQTAKYISTNPRSNAFYEYLPQGYNPSGSETYPVIIFIHGMGELGAGTSTSLPTVLRNGPPKLINQGVFPTSFTVNGVTSKFIVISPQFWEWPGPSDINTLINYVINNYKADQSRIYLTGLSMGGGVVWEYAGSSPVYANRIAAINPICGASWPDIGRAHTIAGANLAVWATHNSGDPTAPVFYTNDYVNYINTAPTPPTPLARKTIFVSNSHDAWSQTYNLSYRENGLNLYEWFLTNQRIITYNPPPIVDAGPDKTITLPTNSVSYRATASDPGGSISIIRWTKVSGPTAGNLDNPTGLWTSMVNLVQGTYVFRLSVTDNGGALTTDDVTVTVNGSSTNQLPVVSAGPDRNITLPTNTTTLTGSGSDPDGTISSFSWTKVAGPSAGIITTPSSPSTTITGLAQGSYTFRLTVTDNIGATKSDDVLVIVNAAPANQPPVVNAGADQTITLPLSSVTLSGTGSDPDGSIATYSWTKVSGPTSFSIGSVSSSNTQVSSLTEGTYVFRLTATDNAGASASDDVVIDVNGIVAPPPPPGSNRSIKVNVFGGQNPYSNTQWNNWNINAGLTSSNLNFDNQTPSTITASITSSLGIADNGASYAASATACPQEVLRYNTYSTSNRTMAIRGLSPSMQYSLKFFASRANTGNKTVIQVGSESYTINTDQNVNDHASFFNVTPDNAGNITVEISRIGTYNYLAGFTITEGSGTAPAPNQIPVVNAGQDISITLPTNSVTLSAVASDPDGSISSYSWSKISGPSAVISSSASPATSVTGLLQGNYVFRVTVTDNSGATASDDVNLTVNPQPVNQTPVVNAGTDITITLPVNSVTLTGTASDPDGSISGYSWSKVSGGIASITNPGNISTQVTDLSQGVYIFRLTVTDNGSITAYDDVQVSVLTEPIPPTPPPTTSGKRILVNIFGGSNPYNNTSWNNWSTNSSLTSSAFKYEDQSASTVTASITAQAGVADNGSTYAQSATIVPSAVLRYNSFNTSNRTVTIQGLNPGQSYTLQFYGSRANTGNKTVVQSAGVSDTISTDNNVSDFATLNNLTAGANGVIQVELSRIGTYNYLAGFIITENVATRGAIVQNNAIGTQISSSEEKDFEIKYLYELRVYPNPVQNTLQLTFVTPHVNEKVIYSVIDGQGRVQLRKQDNATQKFSTANISVLQLRPGVYTLQALIAGKIVTTQFIKQ